MIRKNGAMMLEHAESGLFRMTKRQIATLESPEQIIKDYIRDAKANAVWA